MHSKATVQCFSSTKKEEGAEEDFLGKKIRTIRTDLHRNQEAILS
jgi:hypothetical protein